jgi:hypothetical protein
VSEAVYGFGFYFAVGFPNKGCGVQGLVFRRAIVSRMIRFNEPSLSMGFRKKIWLKPNLLA